MANTTLDKWIFPKGFAWGAATAAYQIEGGWNIDGKGPSVWDTFTHKGGDRVFKNQTGDVACNSYALWEKDLKCIKQLGLTHYRFSLSWARLLPDGTTSFINQKGVDYYNKVINDLRSNHVEPMVTLYHLDLPQALEDRGGWRSEKIVDSFDKYAKFCFRTFGDRVKLWLTINEPYIVSRLGYEDGILPPEVKEQGVALYQVAHNMIKAHARVWHSYDTLFRKEQSGLVSIVLYSGWAEPFNPNSVDDKAASERYLEFMLGWFANPVFLDGDYPAVMKSRIQNLSKSQGLSSSRLPEFTEDEKRMIKGTADFFALNYYTTRKVSYEESTCFGPSFLGDQATKESTDSSWPVMEPFWLAVVPWGIRKLLKYIKDKYNAPAIYITENGFGQKDPSPLEDVQRWSYYRQTLTEVYKAISEDHVDVQGYFAWSLLDNFEWTFGYDVRFGLFHVDYENPDLPRTSYKSAKEYAKVIKNNGLIGPDQFGVSA
ncbi:cytosolic beta-glucosidase-like [Protopterus annectens]|uniref:cytosolic beta-glucosidase-like n=1 Tax=Protopterus annectens TaxID=7888 RepID=UPI001CFAF6D3|nr:cytosolic beta-glucosidase-like [Protopterus annectens]